MRYYIQTERPLATVVDSYDTEGEARAAFDSYPEGVREILGLRIIASEGEADG